MLRHLGLSFNTDANYLKLFHAHFMRFGLLKATPYNEKASNKYGSRKDFIPTM